MEKRSFIYSLDHLLIDLREAGIYAFTSVSEARKANMKAMHSKASFWSRVSVAPAMIALISTSVIVGYASNDIWPDRGQHASRYTLPLPMLRADAQGQGQGNSDTSSGDTSDQAIDPVASYKAALALIKDDYYGSTID